MMTTLRSDRLAGLTPVHVSKVLGQLRRDGLIDFKDRVLTIRDPVALRRIGNV